MFKKIMVFVSLGLLLMNVYGCLLLAGAAGGTGTAIWLSGKLTQEVNAPLDNAAGAAKSALKSLRLKVEKETTEQNVIQIISKYSDGKTIWIDIRKITDSSSKIEVRVGAVSGDKEAADKILKRIMRYL